MKISKKHLARIVKEELNTVLKEAFGELQSLGDIPPLDVPSREETMAMARAPKPRKSRSSRQRAYFRTLARMERRGTIKRWQQKKLDMYRAKKTVAATKKSPHGLPPGIDPSMVPGLPGSPEGKLAAAGSEMPTTRAQDTAAGLAHDTEEEARKAGRTGWGPGSLEEDEDELFELDAAGRAAADRPGGGGYTAPPEQNWYQKLAPTWLGGEEEFDPKKQSHRDARAAAKGRAMAKKDIADPNFGKAKAKPKFETDPAKIAKAKGEMKAKQKEVTKDYPKSKLAKSIKKATKPKKSWRERNKAYFKTLARMEKRGTIKKWQQKKLDKYRSKETVRKTPKKGVRAGLPPGIDPTASQKKAVGLQEARIQAVYRKLMRILKEN